MRRFRHHTLILLFTVLGMLPSCDDAGAPIPRDPSLPADVLSLADGFAIELATDDVDFPVKMAEAPDGRVFFNELRTGETRILLPDGTLQADAFAAHTVETSGERGLIGLALSPEFATDGFVYLLLCLSSPAVTRVVRLRDEGGVGVEETVIVDGLPQNSNHNAGDLAFLPDGTLLVSLGDVGEPNRAQADGDVAGRLLRYAADGSIPVDNPIAGEPEFCRGLRNTFDVAVDPSTGRVWGVENGPTENDELNLLEAGRDYAWPSLPVGAPPEGHRLLRWERIVAPTAIAVHDGSGAFGSEYAGSLFVATWVDFDVRRIVTSSDVPPVADSETIFARFDPSSGSNRPLSLLVRADGTLLVATIGAIWKVSRP